jgi:hypothetical protein
MNITVEELTSLMEDREHLLRRIWALEQQPLKYSLKDLADKVLYGFKSLTPGQEEALRAKIQEYRG